MKVIPNDLERYVSHNPKKITYRQKVRVEIDDFYFCFLLRGELAWDSQSHDKYEDSKYFDFAIHVKSLVSIDIKWFDLELVLDLEDLLKRCVEVTDASSREEQKGNQSWVKISYKLNDYACEISALVDELVDRQQSRQCQELVAEKLDETYCKYEGI